MPAAIWPFSARALSVNEATEVQTVATVDRTIKTCFIAAVTSQVVTCQRQPSVHYQNTSNLYNSLTRYSPECIMISASGAVAAQTGGLAVALATERAPAFAQGTTVHWLRWADFVPASDVLLTDRITRECQKAIGTTLKVETTTGVRRRRTLDMSQPPVPSQPALH
jgi:hypothetical protein